MAMTRAPPMGLSPRVRGNRWSMLMLIVSLRSIPTCAGEPPCRCRSGRRRSVYPRVCGGTRTTVVVPVPVQGLSPRVRGNQGQTAGGVGTMGSIPACAGEPGNQPRLTSGDRVYPRVCGGTLLWVSHAAVSLGLSPRVRGNLGRSDLPLPGMRSIPACAGEPRQASGERQVVEVYPRVCGGTWTAFPLWR